MVNSAEQITGLGRLTRPLVRFLRHLWRLLRAISRYRNSENDGRFAWMAWSLNHIATTDLRAARMKKNNRANITGRCHDTALGSSVSSLWAPSRACGYQVFREVDRGRAANVAPGPVCLPLSVFSLRTSIYRMRVKQTAQQPLRNTWRAPTSQLG